MRGLLARLRCLAVGHSYHTGPGHTHWECTECGGLVRRW